MIKKFLLPAVLAALFAFESQAQTVQDIFNPNSYTVTWLGIDYSHVKIVGSFDKFSGNTISKTDLKERYFAAWNYLVIDEKDKYNIAAMLHRKTIHTDIHMIKKLNEASSVDSIEVHIAPYYSIADIQSFVSAYPMESKPGIGLVFIAESMDKIGDEAYYHVVFFNMETKVVLLHDRLRGTPFGVGLRNYWAGSYYKVIDAIQSSLYSKWKVQYTNIPFTKPTPTW